MSQNSWQNQGSVRLGWEPARRGGETGRSRLVDMSSKRRQSQNALAPTPRRVWVAVQTRWLGQQLRFASAAYRDRASRYGRICQPKRRRIERLGVADKQGRAAALGERPRQWRITPKNTLVAPLAKFGQQKASKTPSSSSSWPLWQWARWLRMTTTEQELLSCALRISLLNLGDGSKTKREQLLHSFST